MVVVQEHVTPEMVAFTEAKFSAWDTVVKKNLLEVGNEAQLKYAYGLLKDPTIYGYAFLKDPDDISKPLRLYPYQDMVINDPHPRVIFAAANQIGKSIGLCVKGLVYALQHPGKVVVIVSKTLPLSKDVLRKLKKFLRTSRLDYEYDIGEIDNTTMISFKHYDIVTVTDPNTGEIRETRVELPESMIVCVPATEGALGYSADLMLPDELPFYENGSHIYKQVLQPRTYATKGQIMAFGNPNGQQGIYWELWNDKHFHCYRFNFFDCPTNTQEEFDLIAESLTQEQIDSTLLARFTSPAGGFFTLKERKDMQDDRPSMLPSVITSPLYVFFDWAKSHDRTTRFIATPINKGENDWAPEVYVHEMIEYPNNTNYSDIIDVELRALIDHVGMQNIAMVGWDNTGVGKGLADFVSRVEQLGIPAAPVEFSEQGKSRIYTLLKLLAEQRRVHIPYMKECDKQLSTLVFKRSKRNNLLVHHMDEKDRDDFPDALAGVCSLIIQPENMPVSAVII